MLRISGWTSGFIVFIANAAYPGSLGAVIFDFAVASFWLVVTVAFLWVRVLRKRQNRILQELLLLEKIREAGRPPSSPAHDRETAERARKSSREYALAWLASHVMVSAQSVQRNAPSQLAIDLWTEKHLASAVTEAYHEDKLRTFLSLREAEEQRISEARKIFLATYESHRRLAQKRKLLLSLEPRHRPRGPRPTPQRYGVNSTGAEQLVADWLRYLRHIGVQVTSLTNDGGVDVITSTHCCQVKNYGSANVTVNEVRELFGVACSIGKVPLMFTSTSLTQSADEFCNHNSIAVIRFDAVSSELSPLNWDGQAFLRRFEYFHDDSTLTNLDAPI